MKLSELINKLETLKEENGDIDVVVQYRDDGGDYGGQDTNLYLTKQNAGMYENGNWVVKKAIVL